MWLVRALVSSLPKDESTEAIWAPTVVVLEFDNTIQLVELDDVPPDRADARDEAELLLAVAALVELAVLLAVLDLPNTDAAVDETDDIDDMRDLSRADSAPYTGL